MTKPKRNAITLFVEASAGESFALMTSLRAQARAEGMEVVGGCVTSVPDDWEEKLLQKARRWL